MTTTIKTGSVGYQLHVTEYKYKKLTKKITKENTFDWKRVEWPRIVNIHHHLHIRQQRVQHLRLFARYHVFCCSTTTCWQ